MGPFRPYKQRMRIALVAAVALVALAAARPGLAIQRVCVVDLDIKSGSVLSLAARPSNATDAEWSSYGAASASGAVRVSLPSAGVACPQTSDEMDAAVAGAWLVEPIEEKGIRLKGAKALDGFEGALVSGIRGDNGASLDVTLAASAGTAALNASGDPEPLAGAAFSGPGCALTAGRRGLLRLQCRQLLLEGALGGWDVQLAGALTATGRLQDAKMAGGPAPAASALPLPVAAGSAAAAAGRALLAAPAAAHDRCAPGAVPAANGSCACAAGWFGRDCSVCSSSAVCPAFAGHPNSTCDTSLVYGPLTSYKAYSCDLVGGLSRWVSGVSAICNTRGERLPFKDGPLGLQPGGLVTLDPSAHPDANRFCKIEVGLVGTPDHPLVCVASRCTFVEGTQGFTCAATSCGCGGPKGCPPLIQGVVDNLANATIGLTCAPDGSGRCVLDGVTPRFSLQCHAGECATPQRAPLRAEPGNEPPPAPTPARTFPMIAFISALPVALLLALGGLFLFHVLAARRLFASGAAPAAPPAPPADAKGVSLLAPQPSIQLPTGDPDPTTAFVFDGIVCSVPDREAAAASAASAPAGTITGGRVAALFRGAAAAAPAAPGAPPRGPSGDGLASSDGAAASALQAAAAAAGRKVLLHGISGVVDQGQVLGVMGPSGSGKSTLLSILSGAVESVGAGARVEGAVSLGGERRRGALRKVTAFVPQRDVLLPALTVEECVRYSALLRLPRSLSAEEIQDRIDGVLSELGLSHVASSLVGGSASIRGVSGGERRRVTIAMALVTRPRLVIMDEPTSGLDSYTAYNLMRTAQEIAMHDRVVIMSLHQPSPDMFDSLSQVLLLAKGRLAYLGTPAGVGPHFAAAGLPVPRKRQPAEHMLHVASQPAGLGMLLAYADKCAGARRRVAAATGAAAAAAAAAAAPAPPAAAAAVGSLTFPTAGANLGAFGSAAGMLRLETGAAAAAGGNSITLNVQAGGADAAAALLEASIAAASAAAPPAAPPALAKRDPSFASLALAGGQSDDGGGAGAAGAGAGCGPDGCAAGRLAPLGRAARECGVLYWRAFTNMRREPRLLLLHIAVALVLGLVVGLVFFKLENTQVGVQNRLGSMFFALALFGWTSVSVVDGLVLERELVEREVAGHYYRGGTYLLSSLVLDGLLLRTLPALLFSALMYPMVGLLPEVSRVVTFMFVLATYSCTVGALTTALTALCRTSSATTLAMNIILLMWVLVGGYLVNPMSIPVWLRWIRNLSPMSFAFEVLAANEMADQMYSLKVAGFAQLEGIKGDVFLRTLGLVPSRALESAVGLSCFYVGSVVLAFAATNYTLWRHGGGTWGRLLRRHSAALLCRGRGARDGQ